MRLDQCLKWSRIVPQRSRAKAVCDAGRVAVNGRAARAGREIRAGDEVAARLPGRFIRFRVRSVPARAPAKADAAAMIEVLETRRVEHEDPAEDRGRP